MTSNSIRRLLTLTENKEQRIKVVADIETEIAKALKGAATSAVEAAETVTPFKPAKNFTSSTHALTGYLKPPEQK